MLTTIERIDQNNEKDFLRFIQNFHALGIKMGAHYHSYGTRFPFCSFWIQVCEGKMVGALCKYYGELFVISDYLDETLEGFLRLFYENATIWMPYELGKAFVNGKSVHSIHAGHVMKKNPEEIYPRSHLQISCNTEVKDMLSVLGLKKEETELLYCDYIRKISKGLGAVYAYRRDEKYVAAASVLLSEDALLLENIRTLPAYRQKGYVKMLVEIIQSCYNKKEIYLLSKNAFTDQVYIRLGLQPAGKYIRIGM